MATPRSASRSASRGRASRAGSPASLPHGTPSRAGGAGRTPPPAPAPPAPAASSIVDWLFSPSKVHTVAGVALHNAAPALGALGGAPGPAARERPKHRGSLAGTPVRAPGLARGLEGGGGGGTGLHTLPARRGGGGAGGSGGGGGTSSYGRLVLRLLGCAVAGLLLSLVALGVALALEKKLGWRVCDKDACKWPGNLLESSPVLKTFRFALVGPAVLLQRALVDSHVLENAREYSGLVEASFFLGLMARMVQLALD
jgi:hypothetical protein